MLTRQVLDCPVCTGTASLSVVFHEHGVLTPGGDALVTVVDYRCEAAECSVPDAELLARRTDS